MPAFPLNSDWDICNIFLVLDDRLVIWLIKFKICLPLAGKQIELCLALVRVRVIFRIVFNVWYSVLVQLERFENLKSPVCLL